MHGRAGPQSIAMIASLRLVEIVEPRTDLFFYEFYLRPSPTCICMNAWAGGKFFENNIDDKILRDRVPTLTHLWR